MNKNKLLTVSFPFYVQLNIIESFLPAGCVGHILAFDERDHLALKKLRNSSFNAGTFHFALQFVKQYSQKFLDIMLHE